MTWLAALAAQAQTRVSSTSPPHAYAAAVCMGIKACPMQVMERVVEVFGQPVPRSGTATPQPRPAKRPAIPAEASGDPALQCLRESLLMSAQAACC